MGGKMGGKGGGKRGGKSGGKKGGKGSGKGKHSGKGGVQVRRELANVVGEVLRGSSEHDVVHPRDMSTRKRKRGAAAVAGPKPSRKALRKAQRKEHKMRRTHFFGEGRRHEEPEKPTKGGTTSSKPGAAPKKQKGQRRRADEEEITSEEEGDEAGKKPKAKRQDAGGAGEVSEGENAGEGEEEEGGDEDAEEESEETEEEQEAEEGATVGKDRVQGSAASSQRQTGSYVPPHLRGKNVGAGVAGGASSSVALLRRQLRGVMNRVTEGNLDPSARELTATLGKLVPEVGTPGAADDLLKVLLPAAVGDANISVLVLGCHAALAAAMHVVFGPAFGAAALLQCGLLLGRSLSLAEASDQATGEDARVARNCVAFESLLFSFGVLPGKAIFDMVRFIFEGGLVSEVRVELALTTLRYAGRSLRAECADDFRELLAFVMETASKAKDGGSLAEGSEGRTRVEYLLRELQDLKNNKVSFTAMDRFDAIRGWLRSAPVLNGKKVADHQLTVPFKFMEEPPPSNWPLSGGSSASTAGSRRVPAAVGHGADAEPLRALAVQQRLSTELRQSLFVALMGAEDFEHAADRVAEVAAKAKAGVAEASVVVFHCAIREKVPNPFYEYVANTLCSRPAPWGKRFCHGLKRAAVQHLQQAHSYGLRATVALAELIAALIASPASNLPVAMVRFVRFGEAAAGGGKALGNTIGLLLRHMVESLLRRSPDEEAAVAIFEPLSKYEDVREGLLLVVDGMVKPRLPPRHEDAALWAKFKAVRRKISVNAPVGG